MKKLLVLLTVILGVFCFGSAVMAEGFTLGADYSSLDDLGSVASIQGEYDMGSFFVGGLYGTVLDFDPAPPPWFTDVSTSIYAIYGGYYFLDADPLRLGAVAAYEGMNIAAYDVDFLEDLETKLTSIAVGLKGVVQIDAFEVSMLYLVGVSNEIKWYVDGLLDFEISDIDVTCFELKGAYQFSETFGAYLVYRSYDYDITDTSGFGAGVQIRF